MATFTKRSSITRGTRWTVQVRCSGVCSTKTFDTRAEGRRWADELERAARLASQGLGPLAVEFATGPTLREAVDRYAAQVLPGLATGDEVKSQLDTWCTLLGPDTPLKSIQTPDILAARETLRERRRNAAAAKRRADDKPAPARLSAATLNRYLAALRRLFNVAIRQWQVVRTNPANAVAAIREPGGRIRWLTDDERGRLLDACGLSPDRDLLPAVLLSLCTAIRRGELMAIEWRDLDLTANLLTVRAEIAKTSRARVIPVAPQVCAMLARRQAAEDPRPGARVFPGALARFRWPFADACTRAKVLNFRWHDLRHTAASYLAMGGASPREIAEITGHQTMAMVMRYTHMSSAHSRSLTDRLAARVFALEAPAPPPPEE